MKDDIGKRLKRVREDQGLTQEEFAEKLGVSLSLVGKYETGACKITRKKALKINQLYGINPSWLLQGKGEMYQGVQEVVMGYSLPGSPHADDDVKIHEMLQKTVEILESQGIFRVALTSNINAFYQALKSEEMISQIKKEMTDLTVRMNEQLDLVMQRLSSLEEENAALKKELASGGSSHDSASPLGGSRPSSRKPA